MSPSLRTQVGTLARRSIATTVRQPVLLVPNLLFPLFMLAVISGTANQATEVPGFPTDSFVTFLIGAIMVQAGVGATIVAGNELGSDIESGFFARLALTPMRASALIAAQLAGVVALGLFQTTVVLLTALAAGASLKAGVGGALVLMAFVVLVILAFGSVGVLVAVKTGSGEQVQAVFSLTLGLIFLSSMSMPRDLMQEEWFKTIATYNPMSYLIEASRSLFIEGWDAEALALGGGIAGLLLIVTLAGSVVSLQSKSVAR